MTTDSRTDGRSVSLDALAAHWRATFAVAADALRVASGCESLGSAARELDERKGRLADERETTLRLLDGIAREEHVSLQPR